MKKSLILGVLALTATAVVSYGQGRISLDNYDSASHPLVTYGAGSGGTLGAGVNTASGYTVGLYFVNTAGNFVANFNADASGNADPFSLYTGAPGTLAIGAGTGSSGTIADINAGFLAGQYAPPQAFSPGLGEGATLTMMVVAYNGSSYANSAIRGHSAAFTMTTSVGSAFPPFSGASETDGGFSVSAVPEPSIFALSGLGGAFLMLIRRKK